jgi:SAM-dependent methyltransferase
VSAIPCPAQGPSETAMRRLKFLTRILLSYTTNRRCPYCDSPKTQLVGRKNCVLQLRQCSVCDLRFRWSKETAGFLERFYQEAYKETGFTTDLPDRQLLGEYLAAGFAGSPKDFSASIGVLKKILPSGCVLDFGCSCGYGVYKLNRAGYDAVGFEISKPRAEHGRRVLHVEIIDSFPALDSLADSSFDGIYASHVLEHLQSLKEVFTFFASVLRPDGVAMMLVPNCGGKMAHELGTQWGPMINEKHTLALDGEFFLRNMPQFGFQVQVLSDPYDQSRVDAVITHEASAPVDGDELMVIAKRTDT